MPYINYSDLCESNGLGFSEGASEIVEKKSRRKPKFKRQKCEESKDNG